MLRDIEILPGIRAGFFIRNALRRKFVKDMRLYLLIFMVYACAFYLVNGIIVSFLRKLVLREGFIRLFESALFKRYMLIAMCGGLLGILVYSNYKSCLAILTVTGYLIVLLVVACVDLAIMEIPNTFVIIALVLGIISIFTMPGTSLPSRILGMFVVSVPLLLITLLVPGAFGGGDIKLMAACGLFLGTKLTLLSFAFAVLTGGLYGIWLLVMKKKSGKEHFAFGPFLCLGMAAALFIGDRVWDWYAGLLYL